MAPEEDGKQHSHEEPGKRARPRCLLLALGVLAAIAVVVFIRNARDPYGGVLEA